MESSRKLSVSASAWHLGTVDGGDTKFERVLEHLQRSSSHRRCSRLLLLRTAGSKRRTPTHTSGHHQQRESRAFVSFMSRIQRSSKPQAGTTRKACILWLDRGPSPPQGRCIRRLPRLSTAGRRLSGKKDPARPPGRADSGADRSAPPNTSIFWSSAAYMAVWQVAGWWRSFLHLCQLPFHGLAAWSITPSALHSPASNTSHIPRAFLSL